MWRSGARGRRGPGAGGAGARGRPWPGQLRAVPGAWLLLLLAAERLLFDALDTALEVADVDGVSGEAALAHAGEPAGDARLLAEREVGELGPVGHGQHFPSRRAASARIHFCRSWSRSTASCRMPPSPAISRARALSELMRWAACRSWSAL